MNSIHKLTFILLFIFATSALKAQQKPDSIPKALEPIQYSIAPVEISAIRVDERAPFVFTDIDSTTINSANGVQDLPYLFNQTPSVVITSDAGAGVGYSGIRIRGSDASRINFTMNGIPVNDGESQTALFVDFPDIMESSESFQIQRGVGSSTNGSGAFGASINMNTLSQGERAYAAYSSAVGSYHTYKNSIKAGTGKLKGGFQFDIRLSKIKSDGYIERSNSDLKSLQFLAGWTSKDQNTSIKFNLLTGKEKTGQAWNGVPQDSLKTNRRYNGLGLMRNGEYYKDQTDNYQQDYYQLFFNHKFNPYWDTHIALFVTRGKGFYDEYKLDQAYSGYFYSNPVFPGGDTLTSTDLTRQLWLDNYNYGTTYSINYQRNKTKVHLGGSFTRYDGKHYGFVTWSAYGFPKDYRWYNLDAFKNDFSIFGKIEQQLAYNLYLFGDLQYRKINYHMNGFRSHPEINAVASYDFFNPKAGLSYLLHHDSGFSKFFGSFAVAHKEPNRKDFEVSPVNKPKPEVLYDTEIGYEFHSKKWSAGVTGYWMNYHNQLVETGKINDVGEYTRQNVTSSYRSGIELTAQYQPIPLLSFTANATFSRNKIKNFHEFIDDYDHGGQMENVYHSADIAFSPDFIAYGKATISPFVNQWKDQQFHVDLIGKHVGRQYLDNTSHKSRSIPAYTLANVQLRYSIKPKFMEKIGINLSLNNVFDKKYSSNGYTFSSFSGGQLNTENFYFPQAGFNIIAGATLHF